LVHFTPKGETVNQ